MKLFADGYPNKNSYIWVFTRDRRLDNMIVRGRGTGVRFTGETPDDRSSYKFHGCNECGTFLDVRADELICWQYYSDKELNRCKICGEEDPAHIPGCDYSKHAKCNELKHAVQLMKDKAIAVTTEERQTRAVISAVNGGLMWLAFFIILIWSLGFIRTYFNYRFYAAVGESVAPEAGRLIDKIGDQFVKGTKNLKDIVTKD